ncbi:zinc finger protein 845-like [Pseudomyrmex gracilis]|uniref:zinc finger protein 845-like n=1 Tax=Pseudomyrmex gracilis TaxID=219809 RepID=UPI000994E96E|nr:zinc finger protein 845-like [Pseudomyrmex gracilis]
MRKSYPCHKCGHRFTRKNNLYHHLKFQCGQLPRFNCPYCTYRTKHASNVRSHVRRIHPDQQVYVLRKKYQCIEKVCYFGRFVFICHANATEDLTNPYPDVYADFDKKINPCVIWLPAVSEINRRWIRQSIPTHKKYCCTNNCGSAFTHRGSLTRHLRYECQQEPRFKCPYCNWFRSRWTSDVYKHVRKSHKGCAVQCIDIGIN